MERSLIRRSKSGNFQQSKTVSDATRSKLRAADTAAKKMSAIIDIFADLGFIDQKDKPR